MNQTQRIFVIAAAIVGGIGFTPQVAKDATLDMSAAASQIEPRFRVSRLRGEVRLQGHTISADQERHLLEEAEFSFPGYAVKAEFEPLGLVPAHWEDTTVRLLHALTGADSGSAELNNVELRLNVVATDELSWASSLRSLSTALPSGITIHDDSVSVPRSDVTALCRNAAAGFSLGPIYFHKSTDEFRPSAYPRLEQLAALADACRNSGIRVTGHTDSSGEEGWNQNLSLLRARAVAAYLESKGVETTRIETLGIGSAEPVASNANRYGRSLNRRIEVEFFSN